MRTRSLEILLFLFCVFPLTFQSQSPDTTITGKHTIGYFDFERRSKMNVFDAMWLPQYRVSARLYIEGKYVESLNRCGKYYSPTNADIIPRILLGWAQTGNVEAKFYELIALNEIALDNFLGADSALKALLREDINYTPSDIAKDDTFNRMFSSYTIKPRLAIGFLGTRLTPIFRNIKRVSIHEDYDYSTSLEPINPSYGFGALVYFSWK
ncbi:MAG: hypothetical protein ACKOW8_10810, partial [Flavobacteriales bacterium]